MTASLHNKTLCFLCYSPSKSTAQFQTSNIMLHYINSAQRNTTQFINAHSGGSFLAHLHFTFMFLCHSFRAAAMPHAHTSLHFPKQSVLISSIRVIRVLFHFVYIFYSSANKRNQTTIIERFLKRINPISFLPTNISRENNYVPTHHINTSNNLDANSI